MERRDRAQVEVGFEIGSLPRICDLVNITPLALSTREAPFEIKLKCVGLDILKPCVPQAV